MIRNLRFQQTADADSLAIVLGINYTFAAAGLGSVIPALHALWDPWVGEPYWTVILFPVLLALSAFLVFSLFAHGYFHQWSWRKVSGLHVTTAVVLGATPWLVALLKSVNPALEEWNRWLILCLALINSAIVLISVGSVVSIHLNWQVQLAWLRLGSLLGWAVGGLALGCIAGNMLLDLVGIRGQFALSAILSIVVLLSLLPSRHLLTLPGHLYIAARGLNRSRKRNQTWLSGFFFGLIVGASCQLWARFLPLVTAGRYTNVGLVMVSALLGFGISLCLAQILRFRLRLRDIVIGCASLLLAILMPGIMFQSPTVWSRLGPDPDIRIAILLPLIALIPGAVGGIAASALMTRYPHELVLRWFAVGMALGWSTFGWIGVPMIGMQSSLGILCALAFLVAMATWMYANYPSRRTRVLLAGMGAAAFLLVSWANGLLGRNRVLPNIWVSTGPARIHETVAGVLTTTPKMNGYRLALNLRPLAARVPHPQQSFSIQLAILRHGPANRVLLLNLAAGINAALTHKAEEVIAVEATQELIDEALRLSPPGDGLSRVRSVVSDARVFLQSNSKTFDVISVGSDVVPAPEHAQFFTEEFFKLARACLAADGVYCHEIAFWNYRVEEVRSIVGTFQNVFPESSLWLGGRKLIMMGLGPEARPWNAQEFTSHLSAKEIQAGLSFSYIGGKDYVLTRPAVFAGAFLCGKTAISRLAKDTPLHTDDLAFLARARTEDPFHAIGMYELLQPTLEPINSGMAGTEYSFVAEVQRAQAMNVRHIVAESLAATADRELQAGDLTAAVNHFSQACEISPTFAEAHLARGDTLAIAGALEQAIAAYQRAVEIESSSAVAHTRLGYALLKAGYFTAAGKSFEEAVRANPSDPGGIVGLAWLLSTSPQEAQRDSVRALRLLQRLQGSPFENQPEVLDALAAALANSGDFNRAVYAAESARQVALSVGNRQLASEIQKREELYRQQKPYRSSVPTG